MMRTSRSLSSTAALFVTAFAAGPLLAADAPCAANYSSAGKSASTFVMTSLTPEAVVERLPRLLMKNGVVMQSAEPAKGTIQAAGLDIKAEAIGGATRVTFRSTSETPADKDTLCRYASLSGAPPLASVVQDPALIVRMKNDLMTKQRIVQPEQGKGLNNATIKSLDDFLDFTVTGLTHSPGKDEYEISMLLPRSACAIVSEDLADAAEGMNGRNAPRRTQPVRVKARMIYENEAVGSHLTDASIISIESTK